MSSITNERIMLAGFPSAGLVGAFALSYLVRSLKMQQTDEIDLSEITPFYEIENGEVVSPIQVYKKNNVVAFLASFPLDLTLANDFISKALEYGRKQKTEKIIVPRGLEIMGTKTFSRNSYGLSPNKEFKNLLKEHDLPTIENASVFGPDAAVISALKNSKIPSMMIYTVCRLRIPDPDAIVTAINTLSSILKVKVDTTEIRNRLQEISKENKRMIEQTKQALQNEKQKPASMQRPGIA